MKTIDVFACYYEASASVNGRDRHAAAVKLTATSAEDFAISYDAYESETVFRGKGRRTKKRDAEYLETETLRAHADALAAKFDGTINWEKPLIEARLG